MNQEEQKLIDKVKHMNAKMEEIEKRISKVKENLEADRVEFHSRPVVLMEQELSPFPYIQLGLAIIVLITFFILVLK
jgi:hypothetical protein